ncbi:response regulator [Oxalobacteraceae bacterium OTU3REALA1]|nr:response regulator [Oxalobacteraceae bacterium OTU3REALA1]
MSTNNERVNKRVLIVEDDADSASILEAYLLREGFGVEIARDGVQAVDLYASWQPDLVLLDLMLPRLSGTEVLSHIRRCGDTPVIMISAIGDEPEKLGALRYGADDYVVKPYSPKEVVARTHAVLRRWQPRAEANSVLRHGQLAVDTGSFKAVIVDPAGLEHVLDLTPTEFLVLALMLRAPFKAFTRSELLHACLPESDALERVVDTHISNLRRKLGAHGMTEVLLTVRSVGYRFQ